MENGQKYEVAAKEEFTPFVLMDKLDDDMIVQELEGRMPEVLTYHFSDKGQEVWGLSKAGVDEAKGELAKKGEVIRELDVNFQDNENEALFWVKAGRYVVSKDGREILLDTAIGFKRQPKKYDRTGNLNPFWFEQGGIKACRNASFRLIPKSVTQAVIEYAKQKGKVKEVKPDKPSTPKPEDMEALKAESKKKAAEYHDRLMKIKNFFELRNYWNKHGIEIKAALMPEHFQMIEKLKDSLKTKFEEKKESHEETGN